ncbi:myotubularin-related protein 7a isoform X1 [Dunckerocampus dactyliophorus]|nr:myotubularin-related protein 7a isoform X1 [Dunckerocampus dactyliophorus]XP_054648501.1 myotubularin-related protein 7a isoform X1 [Dunckerocampus dactyliophorus]XP_054648502.1 myotubularin-related protein 7a isoform X1 [Dunckerocampus dactyliophorus]XP_054648503.1 myotubularin-related protein 7a isoform X1 [Dunckerocampus dactyliophorus]
MRNETWVLHSLVFSVEKQSPTPSGCPLLIHCKNFQVLHFVIPQERECHDVYVSLQRLSQPESYEELYCFSYKPNMDEKESGQEWDFVDLRAEYSRMGLPNSLWKLSFVNRRYKVSDTYPAELFVPESTTPSVIAGSSKFRSRGRFPTLSYYSKDNHAAICRSSQPLSGFSARCLEDEQMLEAILRSNPRSDFMYVVDTRPKLNAMANRAAGKGYENEDNYAHIKFQFAAIENIHVMRNSQQKMLEVCELRSPSMSDFLEGLESSGWLKHIKAVLDASIFIAKAVAEEGVSVLVHCSDGWDRTAQVCSVACVLLDPYYRTIKGLMVLIEKDWVSFGHKFSHRCNHQVGDPKEVSPIIDQFLESLWQLMEQFPCAFEFNERFLITIHSHIYSCQYGNFIGNNQRERIELGLCTRTHSLWSYLWSNRADYTNPLYRPDHSQTQGLLRPSTAPCWFKFWRGLYNRFDRGMHPRQSVEDYLRAVQEETQQLEELLASHKQKIAELEEEQVCRCTRKATTYDKSPTAWVLGNDLNLANTPQDYTSGFLTSSPCQPKAPRSGLTLSPQDLNRTFDSNHSNGSDRESGIADLSCRSPFSEDSTRDQDSDDAA